MTERRQVGRCWLCGAVLFVIGRAILCVHCDTVCRVGSTCRQCKASKVAAA